MLERQSIIREKIVNSDRRKKVASREQLDGEFEHFISSEGFARKRHLGLRLGLGDGVLQRRVLLVQRTVLKKFLAVSKAK